MQVRTLIDWVKLAVFSVQQRVYHHGLITLGISSKPGWAVKTVKTVKTIFITSDMDTV